MYIHSVMVYGFEIQFSYVLTWIRDSGPLEPALGRRFHIEYIRYRSMIRKYVVNYLLLKDDKNGTFLWNLDKLQ